jgi:hypothetical protein
MEHNVSFTPARFNTNQNEEEKSIITSSGPFVVTWNFRKVKQGRLDECSYFSFLPWYDERFLEVEADRNKLPSHSRFQTRSSDMTTRSWPTISVTVPTRTSSSLCRTTCTSASLHSLAV